MKAIDYQSLLEPSPLACSYVHMLSAGISKVPEPPEFPDGVDQTEDENSPKSAYNTRSRSYADINDSPVMLLIADYAVRIGNHNILD